MDNTFAAAVLVAGFVAFLMVAGIILGCVLYDLVKGLFIKKPQPEPVDLVFLRCILNHDTRPHIIRLLEVYRDGLDANGTR